MTQQCEKFGVERASDVINEVHLDGDIKVLKSAKAEYQSKTVIIATGAFARPIGCKGEKEFMGKGVSYCATCDANFFEDFEVYVVGGGDSAVEEAMYLTKLQEKLQLFTDVMNFVQQNPFRRKLPRTKNFTSCGIQL